MRSSEQSDLQEALLNIHRKPFFPSGNREQRRRKTSSLSHSLPAVNVLPAADNSALGVFIYYKSRLIGP